MSSNNIFNKINYINIQFYLFLFYKNMKNNLINLQNICAWYSLITFNSICVKYDSIYKKCCNILNIIHDKLHIQYVQIEPYLDLTIYHIYMVLSYIFTYTQYYVDVAIKNITLLGIKYLPDWIFGHINKSVGYAFKIHIKCLKQFDDSEYLRYKNIPYKLEFYFNWRHCNYEYIDITDLQNLNIISEFAILYNNYKYLYVNLLDQTYLQLEKDGIISHCDDSVIIHHIYESKRQDPLFWYRNSRICGKKENDDQVPFSFGLLPIKI